MASLEALWMSGEMCGHCCRRRESKEAVRRLGAVNERRNVRSVVGDGSQRERGIAKSTVNERENMLSLLSETGV